MAAPWAGGAELRIVGRIHGQITNNVLHFATNQAINDPQSRDQLIIALLTAMLVCVTEQLLPAVSADWAVDHIEARYIAPTPLEPHVVLPSGNTHGEKSAASTSFESTLIEVRTGVGGRSGRGRNFWPPVGESDTTNSLLSDGAFAELSNFILCVAGKFIGAGATEQWRLGVLSRKKLKAAGGTFDTAFTEAETLIAKHEVAMQGRRKLGRGV